MPANEGPGPPDRQKVDLTPHRLAPRLEDSQLRADDGLSTLVGFIGHSEQDGSVRVYLDLRFASYVEVRAGDVVQTAPVDAIDENSPSIVWVSSSAQLRLVSIGRLTGDATFVTGAIRSRYYRQAARRALSAKPETIFPCMGLTDFFDCEPTFESFDRDCTILCYSTNYPPC